MATRRPGTVASVNRQIDALLKAGRNLAKRAKNPAPGFEAGVFTNLDAPKNARTRYFAHARDDWALSNGFPYRLLSAHTDVGAPVKFSKTRAYVAIDEGADGKPVTEAWRISGLQFWGQNPARKSAPRRVTLLAANPGPKYRNEAKAHKKDDPAWIGYAVHRPNSPNSAYAILQTKADAVEYAQKLATVKGKQMAVTRIRYNVAQS